MCSKRILLSPFVCVCFLLVLSFCCRISLVPRSIEITYYFTHWAFSFAYEGTINNDYAEIPGELIYSGIIPMGNVHKKSTDYSEYWSHSIPIPYIVFLGSFIKAMSKFMTVHIVLLQILFDSIVCVLLFWRFREENFSLALLSSVIYAIWYPEIVLIITVTNESLIAPLMILVILLCSLANRFKNMFFFLSIFAFLLSTLISIRQDVFLLFPVIVFFILFLYKGCKPFKRVFYALFFVSMFLLLDASYKSVIDKKLTSINTLGYVLWNSFREYPGTYPEYRDGRDGWMVAAAIQEKDVLISKNDIGLITLWNFYKYLLPQSNDAQLSVYIKKVIFDKPLLYFDWVCSRLSKYFFGIPPLAATLSKGSMYRFSQMYHGLKYLDYMLIALACLGVWRLWPLPCAVIFIIIHFSIVLTHILTMTGEAFWTANEEAAYISPRYFIGSYGCWPVFISAGILFIFSQIKIKKEKIILILKNKLFIGFLCCCTVILLALFLLPQLAKWRSLHYSYKDIIFLDFENSFDNNFLSRFTEIGSGNLTLIFDADKANHFLMIKGDGGLICDGDDNINIFSNNLDFSIDFWFKLNRIDIPQSFIAQKNQHSSFVVYYSPDYGIVSNVKANNTDFTMFGRSKSLNTTTWVHFAFSKSGNSLYGYLDGVRFGEVHNCNFALDKLIFFGIGNKLDMNIPFNNDFYIDNIRISRGINRWSGAAVYKPNFELFNKSSSVTN